MSRFASAGIFAAIVMTSSRFTRANESVPVVVSMTGSTELRVQVSEGITRPCDSENDRLLFDGRLKPGESFRTAIAGDCICLRHTTPAFREAEWTQSGLACRPRRCRGRSCVAAPDPTIAVSLP